MLEFPKNLAPGVRANEKPTMANRGPKETKKEKWLKQVLAYIKKHKRLPPQTADLGRAVIGYRYLDLDFKRKTNAALKKAGGRLQTEAAVETRKAILAYIKKHKMLPPIRHPLCLPCTRFRYHNSKFRRASNAALKKAGGMTKVEAAQKKRKLILAYMKIYNKLPPRDSTLGTAAAKYRATDPKFKKKMDKYRKKK